MSPRYHNQIACVALGQCRQFCGKLVDVTLDAKSTDCTVENLAKHTQWHEVSFLSHWIVSISRSVGDINGFLFDSNQSSFFIQTNKFISESECGLNKMHRCD